MQKQTIAHIKEMLHKEQLNERLLDDLRNDPRKGVQRLIAHYDKQQQKEQELQQVYEQKIAYERHFLIEGEQLIAGVDEAGRGPLAGPLVAAAVILPEDFRLYGLTDSKQLSATARDTFFTLIKQQAISYHIAVIEHDQIDAINIFEATKLAMKEALMALSPAPHIGLIDAVELTGLEFRTESIIKGDDKSIAIAAASVLAKVTRDRKMEELHQTYPMYDFFHNKGYGTKLHLEALQAYGPCICHRKSFSPVREAMQR